MCHMGTFYIEFTTVITLKPSQPDVILLRTSTWFDIEPLLCFALSHHYELIGHFTAEMNKYLQICASREHCLNSR